MTCLCVDVHLYLKPSMVRCECEYINVDPYQEQVNEMLNKALFNV